MNQTSPRVSIGLPVYNAANFLATALDALLAQSFGDFEIVISDNGSTDATPAICEQYAARDARIRYFREETNRGAAWNFNRVVERSRGEYFKWAAHDDLIAPDFLARCVAALDGEPEAVYCHSRRGVIDQQGREIVEPEDPSTAQRVAAVFDATTPSQRYRRMLQTPGDNPDLFGVCRRAAMLRTRLHGAFYGGDRVFLIELSLLGRWIQIAEPLFLLRRHVEQSVWIPTQKAQEQWIHGRTVRRHWLPRQVRCTWESLAAPWRQRLGMVERGKCFVAWCGFVCRLSKWKRLAQDALRGLGINIRVPEDAKRPVSPARGALSSDESAMTA